MPSKTERLAADPANYVDLWGLSANDSSSINYPIKSGETLSQIASDHNYRYATDYTAEEIAALNGISNPDLIYAGDTLKLPVPTVKTAANKQNSNSSVNDNIQNQNTTNKESTIKSWWNKEDGDALTEDEAILQKSIGIGEMVVGPLAGGALSVLDVSAFYAGVILMADGALVITEANNNTKKTPIASIPETFLMPFAQTDDKKVTLPTGGTYIW